MVTSIVLVGGEGLRLGGNKATQLLKDKNLLAWVVEQLAVLSEQILIVGSTCQLNLAGYSNIEYMDDLYPGKGPLGGIYTGLLASESFYNLVVACDMPFLNIELLRYMIRLSPGYDAVAPWVRKAQPLQAVYSKSCLDRIRERLEKGWLSVTRFLSTVNVRYVEQVECQSFDPQLLNFLNINSPVDLAQANMLAAEKKDWLGK
ncbi:MAG: molybdenum cofactor guanylyltransferase [Chloroflexota bacterium]|nr:molybdenum cofactor guanylyltransferase [Chloroflexota bacterium]